MTKPRLLLITRYFPPLDSIATNRMYSWAWYLNKMDYSITVLTTSKKGQVVQPLEVDLTPFEVVELDYVDPLCLFGVDKKRTVSSDSSNRFKRWAIQFYRHRMNERMPGRTDPWILPAVKTLKGWKKAGRHFDAIISSYGPPAAHIIGFSARKIYKVPWVADYRDLWLENHVFSGVWPFTFIERIIEKRVVGFADRLITVSNALANVLETKFPKIPVRVIENGFDPKEMDKARDDYFTSHSPCFRLVYTGSIYPGKRDPSPLFEAVAELGREGRLLPENFQIIFYGSHGGNLRHLIAKHGVGQWVVDGGCVPQPEAYAIQKSCDALLFLEDPKPAVDGILTGKLFEYLYASQPVLGVGVGPNTAPGRLLEETGAGVACGADIPKIKKCLLDLLKGKWTANRVWEKITPFSRSEQVKVLDSILAGLMHGTKSGIPRASSR